MTKYTSFEQQTDQHLYNILMMRYTRFWEVCCMILEWINTPPKNGNITLVGHPQYRKANLWYLIFWVNYQLPKEPILKLAFCLSAWSTRVRFFHFWADIKNPSSIHQERLRGTRLALLVQHTAAHSKNCAWSTDFGMDLYVVSAHVDQKRLAAKCKIVNMC